MAVGAGSYYKTFIWNGQENVLARYKYWLGAEAEFHKAVLRWCRVNKVLVVHSRMDKKATVESGTADMVMCWCGRFVAAELKGGNGALTQSQNIWQWKVYESGGAWRCVRSMEEFEDWMLGLKTLFDKGLPLYRGEVKHERE
jgi:hypothetical protein